jgi:uncharacterized protein
LPLRPFRVEVCLFLSVRELELRKLYFDVTFQPGEIPFEDDVKQVAPLSAQGSAELLSNTLGEIRILGRLKVEMASDCDRCLGEARFPIESEFDLFYRPAVKRGASHEEVELHAGEIEIGFYEAEGLELESVLREFVLLALPMQKVCSEACKGICPVCGQNRNQTECQCEPHPADDRWAALRGLKSSGIRN